MAYIESGASVPVCQMISGKHDHVTIATWLEQWNEKVNQPKEIIIDESGALLLALVQVFTQFDNVIEYLNCCHQIIDGKADIKLPQCFIRHDISHVIKNLKKNKIFDKIDKRTKRFYLLSIGVLFKLEEFEEVKNVIKDILNLQLSEFESSSTEISRRRLTEVIGTHNVNEILYKNEYEGEDEDEASISDNEDSNPLSKTMNWYNLLKMSVLNSIDNSLGKEKENMYYFPDFENFFQKLIYKMPTWSAIMRLSFGSPNLNVSSSNCESEFRSIKRFLFKSSKNLRADKFLFTNIKDIIGRMLVAFADLNKHKKTIGEFYTSVNKFLNFFFNNCVFFFF